MIAKNLTFMALVYSYTILDIENVIFIIKPTIIKLKWRTSLEKNSHQHRLQKNMP
jgi:hypothetical protein